ncbi:hypothetical protein [Flavobacterium chungangensis]|uniref:Uncharacterized protein n=1 Tax=Flavobacterium chungangensis TaxID=2708132 RepID=A0ABV8ZCM3_9FLAO
MELRKEIEPQLEIAEKLYPEILKSIMDYTDFVDENGDEENIEYQKLESKIHNLTGKDMSKYNLWEWWEGEGAEVLSFRIVLPNPLKVEDITKEELSKIVCNRLEGFDNCLLNKNEDNQSFKAQFHPYLTDYYHDFLKLNFKKTYNYPKIFGPQNDKNKRQFWLSNLEKTEKLWNNGIFQ